MQMYNDPSRKDEAYAQARSEIVSMIRFLIL